MKAESLPARNSVFKIQSLCCRGQPLRVSRGLHSAGPATGASRYRRAAASGSVRVASEVGVVVVDHGSKRSQSNEMLEQFREVFELNTDYSIVESAHMEIAEPTILQAAQKCAERGATSIVIAPYFLSRCLGPKRVVPHTTHSDHSVRNFEAMPSSAAEPSWQRS